MMYIDFSVADKNYKLRLNTRNIVALEKQIGCNPLSIFGDGSTIPAVTVMVAVLHASLQQYQHNITLNDAYDIFDAYLDDHHTMTDFLSVIVDIYKVSGLMTSGNDEDNEKN